MDNISVIINADRYHKSLNSILYTGEIDKEYLMTLAVRTWELSTAADNEHFDELYSWIYEDQLTKAGVADFEGHNQEMEVNIHIDVIAAKVLGIVSILTPLFEQVLGPFVMDDNRRYLIDSVHMPTQLIMVKMVNLNERS